MVKQISVLDKETELSLINNLGVFHGGIEVVKQKMADLVKGSYDSGMLSYSIFAYYPRRHKVKVL